MKVIRHGSFSNDGIHFRCERCDCEYMVEDRNDWKVKAVFDSTWRKHVEYFAECPDCGFYKYLGINPNEFNIHGDGYMCGTNIIFNRPDWAERYEVKIDEKNNV